LGGKQTLAPDFWARLSDFDNIGTAVKNLALRTAAPCATVGSNLSHAEGGVGGGQTSGSSALSKSVNRYIPRRDRCQAAQNGFEYATKGYGSICSRTTAFQKNTSVEGVYTKLNILFAIAVLFFANSKILESLTGGNHYTVVISIAGLGTVLTAALQYINRYEERAALHKLAGSEYSALRREVETLLSEPSISDDAINRIRISCDFLAKHGPVVEAHLWRKVGKIVPIDKRIEERANEKVASDTPPLTRFSGRSTTG
jgi:hypothetical protein